MQNRFTLLASLGLYFVAVVANATPQLNKISDEALENQKVLRASGLTMPLYVQNRISPRRGVDLPFYLKGVEGVFPKEIEKAVYDARSQDEFTRRDGIQRLGPWLQHHIEAAKSAEYLLIPVRPRFGEFNFAEGYFPIALWQFDLYQKSGVFFRSSCFGFMWQSLSNPYNGDVPCLNVLRLEGEDRAFTKLPLPVETARSLRQDSANRYRYAVLSRDRMAPQYLAKAGGSDHTYHVLDVDPLVLYVYDSKNGEVVASVPATNASTRAVASTQSQKLSPVTPTDAISAAKRKDVAPLPTIKLQ